MVIPYSRLTQPAAEGARVARYDVLLLAQLARVVVDGGEPLLKLLLWISPTDPEHLQGEISLSPLLPPSWQILQKRTEEFLLQF